MYLTDKNKRMLENLKKNNDKVAYTKFLNDKNILSQSNYKEHLDYIDWSNLIIPAFIPFSYIEKNKKDIDWGVNLYNLYKSNIVTDKWLFKEENHFIIEGSVTERYWWKPSDDFILFFINKFSTEQIESLGAIPFEAFLKRKKGDIHPHYMVTSDDAATKYTPSQLEVLMNILKFKKMYQP